MQIHILTLNKDIGYWEYIFNFTIYWTDFDLILTQQSFAMQQKPEILKYLQTKKLMNIHI